MSSRVIRSEPVFIDESSAPILTRHNFPCPVCLNHEAVHDIGRDIMGPCWTCQGKGWRLVAPPKWVPLWLRRMLGGEQ